jgi:hypothetical protein
VIRFGIYLLAALTVGWQAAGWLQVIFWGGWGGPPLDLWVRLLLAGSLVLFLAVFSYPRGTKAARWLALVAILILWAFYAHTASVAWRYSAPTMRVVLFRNFYPFPFVLALTIVAGWEFIRTAERGGETSPPLRLPAGLLSGLPAFVLAIVALRIGQGLLLRRKVVSDPGNRSAAMIVVPEASGIQFRRLGQIEGITYTIAEPFPAGKTIRSIGSKLAELGWKPLREDWLNPGIPTSFVRGWTCYLDATKRPTARVCSWMTDWSDPDGNLVSYHLSWQPRGTAANQTLHVTAGFLASSLAQREKKMLAQIQPSAAREAWEAEVRREEPLRNDETFMVWNDAAIAAIRFKELASGGVSVAWRLLRASEESETTGETLATELMQVGPFSFEWGRMPNAQAEIYGPGFPFHILYEKAMGREIVLPADVLDRLDLRACLDVQNGHPF